MPDTQEPFEDMSIAKSLRVFRGTKCFFCWEALTAAEFDDPTLVYREVTSWVTGPKLQSPVLRERTGRIAHKKCIKKAIEGQSPDQSPIPGMEE